MPRFATRGSPGKRHARLLPCLLLTLATLGWPTCNAQEAGDHPVKIIGVVLDGPQPEGEQVILLERREAVLEVVKKETTVLARRDFDVRFPEDKLVAGDWSIEGIRSAIDRLMADPEVDVILSLGPFATNELARREELRKPVVAAWALDIDAQGLPFTDDTSGVHNLNYLIARGSMLRDLRKLKELTDVTKVHVVADVHFLELLPEIPELVLEAGEQLGLELITVPGEKDPSEILSAIPPDAEGVYLTPLHLMPASEFMRLIEGLVERRLPSFSLLGQEDVEQGILAGSRAKTEISRLGRRMALNIHRILMGEDARTLPVTLDQPEKLMINMATARAIEFHPRWRVVMEAELIREEPLEIEESLTLSQAVLEAVQTNLALNASDRFVAAGQENVRQARSFLRPRFDVSAMGLEVDEDRAESSFGSLAERTFSGSVSVSQVLYSDDVFSNIEIAQDLQQSLELEWEVERLDVALSASTAFLNVLRAETLERVAKENLSLTESNLELARRREEIGFSGPADVYRWEAELATDRSELIKAHSRLHSAYVVLNSILHRPQEEFFEAHPPSLADPDLVTGFGRLNPYVDNAAAFTLFKQFAVEEGLANSPELEAVDAAIAAQERVLLTSRRSFWSPDVALSGEYERDISKSGAGSTAPPVALVDPPDRDNWSIAVLATLPLYTGGARRSEVRQSREELSALRLEREALAEQIELRIRTALYDLSFSFPNIGLAREAAEAASQNLELVTDAYSRGVVSVIDLLDAQNAALVAEESAANAEYDFLIDLMELQRASNSFDFFRSEAGRVAWFERLEAYFEENADKLRWPKR